MKLFPRVVNWITTLLVPAVLILLAVRVLLTPLYINVEYRLPGFPDDSYGFSFDERLYWANISRQYMLNRDDINFLADQKLNDGTPLYNQRELRHMYDVKVVLRGATLFLYGSLLFLSTYGYWSGRTDRWREFKFAISRGGWLTMCLIFFILVYLVLNFNALFTNFHKIFFEGDSWLFKFSDTLIRLFPIRFWRDAFIWIGAMALLSGFGFGYFGTKGK